VEAPFEASAPTPAAKGWRLRWDKSLSLDLGFDSNARRASANQPTFWVTPDGLAYLFARVVLDARSETQLFSSELQLGAKLFAGTPAEDLLATRFGLRYQRALASRARLIASLSYQDKFQQGDDPNAVAGTELACTSSGSIATERLRCNVRDYRSAALSVGPLFRLSSNLALATSVEGQGFDYKPSSQFSFIAPGLRSNLQLQLARHSLQLGLRIGRRFYHPDSVTWEKIPSGSGAVVVARYEARREWIPELSIGWSWKGRFLWQAQAGVSRSYNNSFGLDAMRLRLDLMLAFRLREGTRLLLGLGLQSSRYPEGNILRGLSLVADQSEQQNSLTLKLSQRLASFASLTLKVQAYSNEITGEVLPFRRLVTQLGLELSL